MEGMFFGISDEDGNLMAYGKSFSGSNMIYRRSSAMTASFWNYESDARLVLDICEKEYPDSTFTLNRFEF